MTIQQTRIKVWIEALRSGKYTQAGGRLRSSDNGFCCLGVGCDISGIGTWSSCERHYYETQEQVGLYAAYMPEDVAAYYGIDEHVQTDLSTKNDVDGWTFNQIADHLEETFNVLR